MQSLATVPVDIGAPAPTTAVPPYQRGPTAFVLHYFRRRAGQFALVFAIGGAASICAVGVQYGMKLLVDVMARGREAHDAVWSTLLLFIGLITAENTLWRVSGWL